MHIRIATCPRHIRKHAEDRGWRVYDGSCWVMPLGYTFAVIHGKKLIVVMPAYNAASTIAQTYADIPEGFVDDIIVVDDASHDDTIGVAKGLGMHTIRHQENRGYGGNQKTCYAEALA